MGFFNDYLYRGTRPNPMPRPPPKRISTPAGQRLSTIVEGNSNNAANGQSGRSKPANRTIAQRLHIGTPPRASFEKRPPSYATQDGMFDGDVEGAHRSHPSWFQQQSSKRGGWKRLGLILALVVAVVIALGVGLGVGLSKDNGNNGHNGKSSKRQPFPAGAWTFATYFTNISTACASNTLSWRCYRDQTYTPSTAIEAQAQFTWIIHESSSSPSEFLISSSANPWSYTFQNSRLELRDANTTNERYSFTLQGLSKQVWPTASLSGNNNLTTCFFNNTMLQANLFTRKAPTLMMQARSEAASEARATSMKLNGQIFQDWPHAVQVEEIAHGGNGVPSCYQTYNTQPVGKPIPLSAMPQSSTCLCDYANFASNGT